MDQPESRAARVYDRIAPLYDWYEAPILLQLAFESLPEPLIAREEQHTPRPGPFS